ncbi:MAG: ABC transporter ATP-binding protein [Deltaproteobacteria bacterium]|nr:ABC transporter ATP-binding protein [Deltaproteobacteria bacterium]
MIELERLTKRYGEFTAVKDLSLRVSRGEIFGFLGPNAAGKTTTIRMMMGLLQPTAGRIRLGGFDLAEQPLEAKRLCGFVPDRPFLYEKLTAVEFLRFCGDLYEVAGPAREARIAELLETFDLADWSGELIESFSHGMKQRLAFTAALLHEPSVLVVDEPMVGMDPRGARVLRATLRSLADRGATLFLSTHSLEIAEALCDRIGIIRSAHLVAVGTLAELRARVGDGAGLEEIFLKLTGAEDLLEVIQALRA